MQRLNHHHLFIFWTFARAGTFTKTAEQLSIAQSAVTAQIKQLEEVLGLTLIDRSNRRRPLLTSDGRRVLEFANSIFESSRELLKWATQGQAPNATTLRLGALSGLSRNLQYEFLKPVLGDRSIKIELTTGDQENLVSRLKDHSLDAILSSHNVGGEGRGGFYSHVLTSSPLIFVTKMEKGLRKNPDLKKWLEEKPLYIPGSYFEARPELDAYLEGLKCPYDIAGEIDDIALLRIFSLRAGAVVVLPEMGVRSDIDAGELLVLGRAGKIEQRFYAITRHKRVPNHTVEELIVKMRKA